MSAESRPMRLYRVTHLDMRGRTYVWAVNRSSAKNKVAAHYGRNTLPFNRFISSKLVADGVVPPGVVEVVCGSLYYEAYDASEVPDTFTNSPTPEPTSPHTHRPAVLETPTPFRLSGEVVVFAAIAILVVVTLAIVILGGWL